MNLDENISVGRVEVSRRRFLELAALGAAAMVASPAFATAPQRAGVSAHRFPVNAFELEEATIADLHAGMKNGKYTAA